MLISRNTTFVPGTVSLFDSVAVVAQCHHPTRWLDGIALTRSPTPPYSFAIQHYFLHQATILSPLLARFPKSALCLVKNEFTHPPKHNKPQTKRRQSMTARGGASCEVACGAVAGPVPALRLLHVHRCIRRTAVLMGVRCEQLTAVNSNNRGCSVSARELTNPPCHTNSLSPSVCVYHCDRLTVHAWLLGCDVADVQQRLHNFVKVRSRCRHKRTRNHNVRDGMASSQRLCKCFFMQVRESA